MSFLKSGLSRQTRSASNQSDTAIFNLESSDDDEGPMINVEIDFGTISKKEKVSLEEALKNLSFGESSQCQGLVGSKQLEQIFKERAIILQSPPEMFGNEELLKSVGLWKLDANYTEIESRFDEFQLKMLNVSKLIQSLEQNNCLIEIDEVTGRFDSLERDFKVNKFQPFFLGPPLVTATQPQEEIMSSILNQSFEPSDPLDSSTPGPSKLSKKRRFVLNPNDVNKNNNNKSLPAASAENINNLKPMKKLFNNQDSYLDISDKEDTNMGKDDTKLGKGNAKEDIEMDTNPIEAKPRNNFLDAFDDLVNCDEKSNRKQKAEKVYHGRNKRHLDEPSPSNIYQLENEEYSDNIYNKVSTPKGSKRGGGGQNTSKDSDFEDALNQSRKRSRRGGPKKVRGQTGANILSTVTENSAEDDEEKVECPMCNVPFSVSIIEAHAARCGDIAPDDIDDDSDNNGIPTSAEQSNQNRLSVKSINGKYVCDFCKSKFTRQTVFVKHTCAAIQE